MVATLTGFLSHCQVHSKSFTLSFHFSTEIAIFSSLFCLLFLMVVLPLIPSEYENTILCSCREESELISLIEQQILQNANSVI